MKIEFTPRSWQKVALRKWKSESRGTISVVTGGGKTFFSFLCIENFLVRNPDGKILIIVPTTALLDQWHVSLQEDFKIEADQISVFSSEEKSKSISNINLMVINTARTRAVEMTQEGAWMLVVDECHRAGSPHNAKALVGKFVASLGLSATPVREYDSGFEDLVAPALGPIIYEYSYLDAMDDEVICPFDLENIFVPMLDHEQSRYAELSKKVAYIANRVEKGIASEEALSAILRKRAKIAADSPSRIPVAAKIVDQHPGTRTIIFHESIQIAEKIRDVLDARGHRVTSYHSKIGPAVRRSNLAMFRNGLFDVLVSCRALDEGANVPETSVAIIAASTSSLRQRIQRLGRVLRPFPGKSSAKIITLYSTNSEKARLQDEHQQFKGVAGASWATSSIQS